MRGMWGWGAGGERLAGCRDVKTYLDTASAWCENFLSGQHKRCAKRLTLLLKECEKCQGRLDYGIFKDRRASDNHPSLFQCLSFIATPWHFFVPQEFC